MLGRGAAGKSTFARQLGQRTGLPVIELDTVFWHADLTPTPTAEWAATQRKLAAEPAWIMDGDLGPYDALEVRLRAADTVVLLDFALLRCAWRAVRRSRERADFWWWLVTYRGGRMRARIAAQAPDAELHVLRRPSAVRRFLATARGS